MNKNLHTTNKLLASLLNTQIMSSKLIEIQIQQTQVKHLLRQAGAALKEFQREYPDWHSHTVQTESYLSLQGKIESLSDKMAALAAEAAVTYKDIERSGNQAIMEAEDETEDSNQGRQA